MGDPSPGRVSSGGRWPGRMLGQLRPAVVGGLTGRSPLARARCAWRAPGARRVSAARPPPDARPVGSGARRAVHQGLRPTRRSRGITALVAGRQFAWSRSGWSPRPQGSPPTPSSPGSPPRAEREMESEVGSAVRATHHRQPRWPPPALFALALPAVRLAYQRGSFGPEDTLVTTAVLAFYALSIPAWGAQQVYPRLLRPEEDVAPGAASAPDCRARDPGLLTRRRRFGLDGSPPPAPPRSPATPSCSGRWFIAAGRPSARGRLRAGRALVGGVSARCGRSGYRLLAHRGRDVPDVRALAAGAALRGPGGRGGLRRVARATPLARAGRLAAPPPLAGRRIRERGGDRSGRSGRRWAAPRPPMR